jgi:hypothetical protein
MGIMIAISTHEKPLKKFHPVNHAGGNMDWLTNTPFLTKERGFFIAD